MRAGTLELTFDDGPDPVWTPVILQALAHAGLTASFFVVARNAAAHPGLVAATLAAGHTVELHCAAHVRPTRQTREEAQADIVEALALLAGIGVRPGRWRTPWGLVAPWTAAIARRHGLVLTGWTVDSHDWRGDDADAMLRAMAPALVDDATVLLHDGVAAGARRAGCAETAALVTRLGLALASRGLRTAPPTREALAAAPFPPPRGGSLPVAG